MKLLRDFFILSLFLSTTAFASVPQVEGDTRQIQNSSSPLWIEATGKLRIKEVTKREGDKVYSDTHKCSLGLVNLTLTASKTAITGAHCLYPLMDYQKVLSPQIFSYANNGSNRNKELAEWLTVEARSPDFSGEFPIKPESQDLTQTVTFRTNDGRIINRKIIKVSYFNLAQKRTDYRDTAVVEFDRPISVNDIEPLIVRTVDMRAGDYKSFSVDEEEPWMNVLDFSQPRQFGVSGYNADDGKGQNGDILTYTVPCKLTNGVISMPWFKNCYTYQGGSGGPVVVSAKIGQSWCFNDDVDEDAEKPIWFTPLSETPQCEEPEHWNEVIVNRRVVGHLPVNRVMAFHIGNASFQFEGEPVYETRWAPNAQIHDEIIDALADVYFP